LFLILVKNLEEESSRSKSPVKKCEKVNRSFDSYDYDKEDKDDDHHYENKKNKSPSREVNTKTYKSVNEFLGEFEDVGFDHDNKNRKKDDWEDSNFEFDRHHNSRDMDKKDFVNNKNILNNLDFIFDSSNSNQNDVNKNTTIPTFNNSQKNTNTSNTMNLIDFTTSSNVSTNVNNNFNNTGKFFILSNRK
jgi:hypothetical protein